jgi:hypothetical protein
MIKNSINRTELAQRVTLMEGKVELLESRLEARRDD